VKFALHPLQWGALPNGDLDMDRLPAWPELMRELAALGIGAVHTLAETPDQADAYRQALDGAGLAAAPGYFWFPAAGDTDLDHHLARARDAARVHRALGVDRIFVADGLNPVRLARPARGVEPDPHRLAHMSGTFSRVAEVFAEHGVRPCLHQHVASWIESEEEFLWLLDHTDPGLLFAGPDTGHLALVGADPVKVVERLGERVQAAHLKDVRLDRLPAPGHLDYHGLVATGVYTEPGRGDLDLAACLDRLRAAGAAWAVVEVDRPDGLAPADSARACAAWIHAHQ
jgi:inosose dehydratase